MNRPAPRSRLPPGNGAHAGSFRFESARHPGHGSANLRRLRLFHSLLLGASLATGTAEARRAKRAPLELNVFGPSRPLSETAWLLDGIGKNRRFQIGSEPLLGLLERYLEPERDRAPEWRSFWRGRYGRKNWQLGAKLAWSTVESELLSPPEANDGWLPFAELREPAFERPLDFSHADVLPDWAMGVAAPEPELLGIAPRPYCPRCSPSKSARCLPSTTRSQKIFAAAW